MGGRPADLTDVDAIITDPPLAQPEARRGAREEGARFGGSAALLSSQRGYRSATGRTMVKVAPTDVEVATRTAVLCRRFQAEVIHGRCACGLAARVRC